MGIIFSRENVVSISPRVARNAIAQQARPRRLRTLNGAGFASCQNFGSSPARGADSSSVRLLQSNQLGQFPAESKRFSGPENVRFHARRFSQTALPPGILYGFPTAAKGSSQQRPGIKPTRVMVARSRIAQSLFLAREAIP